MLQLRRRAGQQGVLGLLLLHVLADAGGRLLLVEGPDGSDALVRGPRDRLPDLVGVAGGRGRQVCQLALDSRSCCLGSFRCGRGLDDSEVRKLAQAGSRGDLDQLGALHCSGRRGRCRCCCCCSSTSADGSGGRLLGCHLGPLRCRLLIATGTRGLRFLGPRDVL